ncbi:hypothetical protein JTB14_023321 [Gonioctena quinquepunctata]|nr:hypothetical protein JTB14_023321 [Gonioctena quinquepunctata]
MPTYYLYEGESSDDVSSLRSDQIVFTFLHEITSRVRLAKLPKAFDFDGVTRGYFPHLFDRAENWHYVGPLPALEYYDPGAIKYTPTLDEERDPRKQLIDWNKGLSE